MRIFIYLAAMALVFPGEAFAYIDPGTGSLILQGLAAAAISALVFWREMRRKIKNFFTGNKAESGTDKRPE